MKHILFSLVCFFVVKTYAQDTDQKFFIITTDGLRWQEVFKGMDSLIAVDTRFNQDDSLGLFKQFWNNDGLKRRALLMPFFWNTVQSQGQLYGNRILDSKVDNANIYWFSYPGYSELLTAQTDTAINSNDYPPNPYENVLEHFNKKSAYKNKVAAFGSWNAFDRILNEKRSGFPVINALDNNASALDLPQMRLIHQMIMTGFRPFGNSEILDVFTHYQALTYLKSKKPKAFFISYGDTDEWAHHGDYKFYLDALHQFDGWVEEIWKFVQSDPFYKNKTTLLITTDHGRGDIKKEEWTSHGQKISDAHQTWFAFIGPRIKPLGEMKNTEPIYQKQLVPTLMKLVGETFLPKHITGEPFKIPMR